MLRNHTKLKILNLNKSKPKKGKTKRKKLNKSVQYKYGTNIYSKILEIKNNNRSLSKNLKKISSKKGLYGKIINLHDIKSSILSDQTKKWLNLRRQDDLRNIKKRNFQISKKLKEIKLRYKPF